MLVHQQIQCETSHVLQDEFHVVFTYDCMGLWHNIKVLWGAWQCGNYIWCRTCNEPLTVYAECSASHAWVHWYDFLYMT